ncbi:MAG: methylmalonyl-CoA mutase small subunit [Paludibacteraceae bacterium]|nr:methylmalonyl-CoA mutase small subunit [Paludibacteraceae bacterium]MBR0297223.1 methylmalonyl-CoA mutase small subunit [Paludibacteraceae bacterium]
MEEKLNLLADFPAISTKEWKDKIITDLKGADFDKKLVWRTPEGFNVQPFYRQEDLRGLKTTVSAPGQFPYVRGTRTNNEWAIRQNICACENPRKANKLALDILNKGITSLGFCLNADKLNYRYIKNLLKDIDARAININYTICACKAAKLADILVRYYGRCGYDFKAVYGSINVDPIKNMLIKGKDLSREQVTEKLVAAINACKTLVNYRVVGVNSVILNNSGAYCAQELAYALAWGADYMTMLTEAGVPNYLAAREIRFNMGIGGNYFMEIAKFRAARLLWAKIVEAYKAPIFTHALKEAAKMNVCAETSRFNMTIFDAYVNLLRTQTETMSAALAGVDEIIVSPFDVTYERPTEFAERIARNQQLLLKEEAHFDKVVDPAAGSYYLENLTNSIAAEAWKQFLAIQEQGGFFEMVKAGKIQEAVAANLKARLADVAKRKEVLLGSNQFPNFTEKAAKKIKDNAGACSSICNCKKNACEKPAEGAIPTLPVARAAEEFEQLRLETEGAKHQPIAFMLTIGNLAMRIARAQFSCNFLACAGYKVIDNNGFKSVHEGIKAARKAKADIIVLCSSDDEYATFAPQAWLELEGAKEMFIVAGAPACMEDLQKLGIQNFIHIRCNVLETLKQYNSQLLNK